MSGDLPGADTTGYLTLNRCFDSTPSPELRFKEWDSG